jgi:indole-3-glycerol phosphate synthase
MGVLEDIVASKAREVAALQAVPRRAGCPARAPLDVVATLRRDGGAMRLLAEVKLRSPSAGPLSRALSPAARALAYARAGASMVSVLCDGPFFDGAWEHLSAARAALDAAGLRVPLLAKEFVVHARQVQEARDRGADAVLLIGRIVPAAALVELARVARDEGLEPLVEVAAEPELDAAAAAGARVVGVNARDLDTLEMDPARAARVLDRIAPGVVAVHLSGVRDPADVARLAATRADAALVGETLMRQDDPTALLCSLVAAAAPGAGPRP